MKLGGNIYINTPNLVAYRGEPLFTLRRHDETGYLGIDFDIYNAQGEKVAAVRRSEIYIVWTRNLPDRENPGRGWN